MRFICAELLAYADGIEFAIGGDVDILICKPKTLPIGFAIPFFEVRGASFEE
jgi:hypothetical protein